MVVENDTINDSSLDEGGADGQVNVLSSAAVSNSDSVDDDSSDDPDEDAF